MFTKLVVFLVLGVGSSEKTCSQALAGLRRLARGESTSESTFEALGAASALVESACSLEDSSLRLKDSSPPGTDRAAREGPLRLFALDYLEAPLEKGAVVDCGEVCFGSRRCEACRLGCDCDCATCGRFLEEEQEGLEESATTFYEAADETDLTFALTLGSSLVVNFQGSLLPLEREVTVGNNATAHLLGPATLLAIGAPHRVLTVATGSAVEMRSLTIRDGAAYGAQMSSDPDSRGGCVRVQAGATLAAHATTFTNCTAYVGGGIVAEPTAVLTLDDSMVLHCVAGRTGGGIAAAGATLTIKGSSVVNCHSRSGGGVGSFEKALAGGTMAFNDVRVVGCTALIGGGGLLTPKLGSVRLVETTIANSSATTAGGGLIHFGGTQMTLSNSHLHRCATPNFYGGGIFGKDLGLTSSTTLERGSTITKCTSATFGGGIFAEASHSFLLRGGSSISDCSSGDGGGGASFKVSFELSEGSRISRCDADVGGALFVSEQSATVSLKDSFLSDNTAFGGGGGAIALPRDAKVYVLGSELSGNSAPNGVGGAIACAGGQVWLMAGSRVVANLALIGGGVALNTLFRPGWFAGGAEGRLFASGPRCSFVRMRLGFDFVKDTTVASTTYSIIQDEETGGVVDARGQLTLTAPVAGQTTTTEFCLQTGRTYRVALTSITGSGVAWSGATANLVGPLEMSSSSQEGSTLAVPDEEWESRMAVHHAFTLPPMTGEGALVSRNVALDTGGAMSIADQAAVYVVDALFESNIAFGCFVGVSSVGAAGGAAHMGTACLLEARTCTFANNSGPLGRGGGLYVVADCVVRLEDCLAVNNTASISGGFASFRDSKEVRLDRSTFSHNSLLSGKNVGGRRGPDQRGGGGAIYLDGVQGTHVTDSTFDGNKVRSLGEHGGAIDSHGTFLTIRSTGFFDNVAAHGNGGALAVSGGGVSLGHHHDGEKRCSPVQVVVDYSATEDLCGQWQPGNFGVCDYVAGRCLVNLDVVNPFFTEKNFCAGCSCPWDDLKYFKLSSSSEEIPVFDAFRSRWDPRALGRGGSIMGYEYCLEDGEYSAQAFDELDQGWWGATLTVVQVNDGDFQNLQMGDWSGSQSSLLEFTVRSTASFPEEATLFVGNSAPRGGGGGVYWVPAGGEEPEGLLSSSTCMAGNSAMYGADVATEASALTVALVSDDDNDELFPDGLVALLQDVLRPAVRVSLVDWYGTVVLSDSASSVLARAWDPTTPTTKEYFYSTSGSVEVTQEGVATFDKLSLDASPMASSRGMGRDLAFELYFTATALGLSSGTSYKSLDNTTFIVTGVLKIPERPQENKNKLGPNLQAFMLFLVALNLLLAAICAMWTRHYQNRVIVELSQPTMLYWLCAGCVVSSISSISPLVGFSHLVKCQLMLWLYGTGFVITTSTLHSKMFTMQAIVQKSLKVVGRANENGTETDAPRGSRNIIVFMAGGEFLILFCWTWFAPFRFKRSCVEKEKGGPWDGLCIESVGKCRTTHGMEFVSALCVWHICCLLAGMIMCYKVRNIPSIMAEGKFIFTGFYSQLQVFVTAVPVLAIVRDQYTTFTLLKSLIICVGDLTTLSMIFLPKMLLVYEYGDFSQTAVARYIVVSMSNSTQTNAIYDSLRAKRDDQKIRRQQKQQGTAALNNKSTKRFFLDLSVRDNNNKREQQNQMVNVEERQTLEEDSPPQRVWTNNVIETIAKWATPATPPQAYKEELNTSSAIYDSVSGSGRGNYSSLGSAKADRILGKTSHYLNHEIKNRLHVLADPECDTETRLLLVTELQDIISSNSSVLLLATGRYLARLEDCDLSELIEIRLQRYRGVKREITRLATYGASQHERSLRLDKTLINIILDNVLSNAFKYGDGVTPPLIELTIDEPSADGTTGVCLQVTNKGGQGHAALLKMGENELNRVAAADGERAHGDHCASTSAGDGFPMALASARVLAGAMWLCLRETEIVVRLDLPRVSLGKPRSPATSAPCRGTSLKTLEQDVANAALSFALIDDSLVHRTRLERAVKTAFPNSDKDMIVGGHDAASVESFVRDVLKQDIDVVLLDQDFGLVYNTQTGTDLIREIRAADKLASRYRLLLVTSVNDSPKDLEMYLEAGADGLIPKAATSKQLRAMICDRGASDARFITERTMPKSAASSPTIKKHDDAAYGDGLRFAMIDDSLVQRKRLLRALNKAFPMMNPEPIVSGHDAKSVDTFSSDVIEFDADIVITDQNFGLVHEKKGTDLVREIRALDAAAGRSRLIFVASANDTPEDVGFYIDAGADGNISKSVKNDELRVLITQAAAQHSRFAKKHSSIKAPSPPSKPKSPALSLASLAAISPTTSPPLPLSPPEKNCCTQKDQQPFFKAVLARVTENAVTR